MSAAEAAHSPRKSGSGARLWLLLALLVVAAIALAWVGAGSMRGTTTDSGVQIRTIEEGSGAFIEPVDGVMIEYEGRLEDGTVFDSSEGRGPTPMIAGQVIPGFAEALSMMQQGGRYTIRIPGELAYGDKPPPGSPIPANADLLFDVHVAQVVPNAAMMIGPEGAAPGGQVEQGPEGNTVPIPPQP